MTPTGILAFVRSHRLAVLATVSEDGLPEAALMGFAMTADARIVFDTSRDSRKFGNLRRCSDVALVVGLEDEVTVQLEGHAYEPTGDELARCKASYFDAFPDGREREAWPNIAYFAVRITWMRYSDYRAACKEIIEHRL